MFETQILDLDFENTVFIIIMSGKQNWSNLEVKLFTLGEFQWSTLVYKK